MVSATSRKSNWSQANPLNKRGFNTSAGGAARNFVGLGIVETDAPVDALRAATKSLNVRFVRIVGADTNETGRARYRAEVELPADVDAPYAIKLWETIKEVLRTNFLADRGKSQMIEIIDT
jgi:hypothetical protein